MRRLSCVDEQDRGQGRAVTTEATDRKVAGATGSSTGDAAADKRAAKRRLSELHRLLNSRKGSFKMEIVLSPWTALFHNHTRRNTTNVRMRVNM